VSQQQKSPHEEFIMSFIVVFLVVGIAYVIWIAFRPQLTEIVRYVRIGELYIGSWLHGDNFGDGRNTIGIWRNWLWDAPVKDITSDHIKASTPIAVYPIRYVFVALLGLMALVIMFKGPGTYYRRRMGLEQLMREQASSLRAARAKGQRVADSIRARVSEFSNRPEVRELHDRFAVATINHSPPRSEAAAAGDEATTIPVASVSDSVPNDTSP
jgi:hypothetical protein